MKIHRFIYLTIVAAASISAMASGPKENPQVTDGDKQAVRERIHAILDRSVLPEWAGVVLSEADRGLDSKYATWTKSRHEFVHFSIHGLSAQYFGKRSFLMEYRLSPSWLVDRTDKPDDLMSIDHARERTEALLTAVFPEGWQVHLKDSSMNWHGDGFASFDWEAQYKGYPFRGGNHIEVDRLTGAITDYFLQFGFFPRIRDEDCPNVDEATLSALRAEGHRVYTRYRPLERANVSPGRLVVIVPGFKGHPNEMTARHVQRFDDRDAILACLVVAYGQEPDGTYCQQLIYVDAVTGKPIGIYDEPLKEDGLGPSGSKPNLVIDVGAARWSLLEAGAVRPFRLKKARASRKLKSDGTCVLVTQRTKTTTFHVDLSQKKLWTGTPERQEAWATSPETWKALIARLKARRPFPATKKTPR